MSGKLTDDNFALTPRTLADVLANDSSVVQRTTDAVDLVSRSHIRRRRLTDVLNGIADARRRVDRFTSSANAVGNMDAEAVNHGSVVKDWNVPSTGNIGRQLELFYYGHDTLHSTNELRTRHDRKTKDEMGEERREDDMPDHDTQMYSNVAAVDGKQTTSHEHLLLQHQQRAVLPPLLSSAVWRDGDQIVEDPAFCCEPEVPLSDLPSPARRFPLLSRPKRYDIRTSGSDPPGRAAMPTRTRALPVCPASNCRLISLSWDENFFVDDDQTDNGGKCRRSQMYGSSEVVSLALRNGFPKRRPIAARAKLPLDYYNYYSVGKVTRCHGEDDGDVVGYRRHWKELANDKRRLNEDDWKRENTRLFMDHVSALLKTSKSPKNS